MGIDAQLCDMIRKIYEFRQEILHRARQQTISLNRNEDFFNQILHDFVNSTDCERDSDFFLGMDDSEKNKLFTSLNSIWIASTTDGGVIDNDDFDFILNPFYGQLVIVIMPIGMLCGSYGPYTIEIKNSFSFYLGMKESWKYLYNRIEEFINLLAYNNDGAHVKSIAYKFKVLYFKILQICIEKGLEKDTIELEENRSAVENIDATLREIDRIIDNEMPKLQIDAHIAEAKSKINQSAGSFEQKVQEKIAQITQYGGAVKETQGSDDIAGEYSKLAKKKSVDNSEWLWATCILATATIVAIIFAIYWHQEISEYPYHIGMGQLILYASPRILLVSVLLTATLWSGRLYKVGKHLEENYEQLVASIRTANKILGTDVESELRKSILPQLINSLFVMPDSGYITGKDDALMVSVIDKLNPQK